MKSGKRSANYWANCVNTMQDHLLLTAGPTPISEEVKQILSHSMFYHRSEKFIQTYESVTHRLQYWLRTKNDVIILTGSGTAGMEATISNLFSPGDHVLVVENGKFSQRWSEIAEAFQLKVFRLVVPWGKSVGAEALVKNLTAIGSLKGIFLTHCETSTGALTDLEIIIPAIRHQTSALIVVDAISSAGILPLKPDDWGIDVIVSASQKGLGLPPGLAFVALNNRAWIFSEQSELPKYYLDLTRARQSFQLGRGALFTPAISLIFAADHVLSQIQQKGLENIWRERQSLAHQFRARLTELGLSLFPEIPADSMSVIKFEPSVNAKQVHAELKEKFGILVSRGQGQLAQKVIRVGHMTNIGEPELERCLSAIQTILSTKIG
ncbi:MAG TPA: alanine--glyoxylate aminotransferase family protein [bacterium]|nr:alanine--glyoxylate aminotransferase family protein [bacterium]